MYGIPMTTPSSNFPICSTCQKPVVLETSRVDNFGKPVHEGCYLRNLKLAPDLAALAALADQRLRATPEQLRDALGAGTELNPVYRRLVKMMLEDLQLIEQQIGQLD